ncbi:MAG: hydroxymethylglutaryl-CoA lyase [Alphaproteobacteria bacterium]|nr:hydroxymethylglutaryl-CoA lyase [Alphaproteobacteria bacterium]
MSDFPKKVKINEEGPREGFQIEKPPVPTDKKIRFINALSGTGLKHIQTVSFVNPKRVPGWADAEEVVMGQEYHPGVEYAPLWLNPKGFERAMQFRDKLTLRGKVSLSASEAFVIRNQNKNLDENLKMQHEYMKQYKAAGVPVDCVGVNSAFGCNYQGDIPTGRVLEAIGQCFEVAAAHGESPPQIRLSDTMAWATPDRIKRTVGAVREKFPDKEVHLHLHDTRGMAMANAYAGLEMGVASYDAAVAGLGGCPFAGHAGAAGNICTEDLVFLCHEMGIETGIDLDALIEAAQVAEEAVGHPLPGKVAKGGNLARLREKAGAVH